MNTIFHIFINSTSSLERVTHEEGCIFMVTNKFCWNFPAGFILVSESQLHIHVMQHILNENCAAVQWCSVVESGPGTHPKVTPLQDTHQHTHTCTHPDPFAFVLLAVLAACFLSCVIACSNARPFCFFNKYISGTGHGPKCWGVLPGSAGGAGAECRAARPSRQGGTAGSSPRALQPDQRRRYGFCEKTSAAEAKGGERFADTRRRCDSESPQTEKKWHTYTHTHTHYKPQCHRAMLHTGIKRCETQHVGSVLTH